MIDGYMSIAKEAGIAVPEFYLSDNAELFVMRRFDRDEQLNPFGFEDMAVLMGLATEQKYSKELFGHRQSHPAVLFARAFA